MTPEQEKAFDKWCGERRMFPADSLRSAFVAGWEAGKFSPETKREIIRDSKPCACGNYKCGCGV